MKTIKFPGRFASLPKVGEFVRKAAISAGLNDKAVYAVQLAVDEACSNIIDHAYGGEGNGEMVCSVVTNRDGLTVILRDRGKPFNPQYLPDPDINVPLDRLKPRGVGVYLMRKMMDEVYYEYSADGSNVLTMVKYRTS